MRVNTGSRVGWTVPAFSLVHLLFREIAPVEHFYVC